MEKKITRLYSGLDGESHFEDIEVPLEGEECVTRRSSELLKATGICFGERGAGFKTDWHNAPQRQFVITREGMGEIEIGDGTKRRFGPGDILLAEDTTGRGHISRVVGKQTRKIIIVTLATEDTN